MKSQGVLKRQGSLPLGSFRPARLEVIAVDVMMPTGRKCRGRAWPTPASRDSGRSWCRHWPRREEGQAGGGPRWREGLHGSDPAVPPCWPTSRLSVSCGSAWQCSCRSKDGLGPTRQLVARAGAPVECCRGLQGSDCPCSGRFVLYVSLLEEASPARWAPRRTFHRSPASVVSTSAGEWCRGRG